MFNNNISINTNGKPSLYEIDICLSLQHFAINKYEYVKKVTFNKNQTVLANQLGIKLKGISKNAGNRG
jgi:hypothetical protein